MITSEKPMPHNEPETDKNPTIAVIQHDLRQIRGDLVELKAAVLELSKPRPTNWMGILGVCLLAMSPAVGVLTLYVAHEVDPVKQASAFDKREREWFYDSVEKHMAQYERIQDKLFERVFAESAPTFIAPVKKN